MSTSRDFYCSFNWRGKVGFLTVFFTDNSHLCDWDSVKVCNAQNSSTEESSHSVNFFAVATNVAIFFDCFRFNSRHFCVVETP